LSAADKVEMMAKTGAISDDVVKTKTQRPGGTCCVAL
jgi:hypothetical protein